MYITFKMELPISLAPPSTMQAGQWPFLDTVTTEMEPTSQEAHEVICERDVHNPTDGKGAAGLWVIA